MSELTFLCLCLAVSFQITAIHVCCWPGNVLFKVRNSVGNWLWKRKLKVLHKPLFECLPCMSSFWGLIFWALEGMQFNPLAFVLCICGMLAVVERVVKSEMPIQ